MHEAKQYGLLCDLAAHADVVGLASPHQVRSLPMLLLLGAFDRSQKVHGCLLGTQRNCDVGQLLTMAVAALPSAVTQAKANSTTRPSLQVPDGVTQAPGTAVQALVLDVNKRDGIVDLSLQPRLVAAAEQLQPPPQQGPKKKKQKKGAEQQQAAAAVQLAEGQRVEATVELVKGEEGYCVVSLAVLQDGGTPAAAQPLLGFLPTTDFNLQNSSHQQPKFDVGQSLTTAVAALPSAATGGRLLLTAPLGGRPARPQPRTDSSKGGDAAATKRPSRQAPAPGSCVEATVSAVHNLHADLALAGGSRGRLHASQSAVSLADLAIGATLQVAVVGKAPAAEGRRSSLYECSARPDAVASAAAGQPLPAHLLLGWGGLKPGQQLAG